MKPLRKTAVALSIGGLQLKLTLLKTKIVHYAALLKMRIFIDCGILALWSQTFRKSVRLDLKNFSVRPSIESTWETITPHLRLWV